MQARNGPAFEGSISITTRRLDEADSDCREAGRDTAGVLDATCFQLGRGFDVGPRNIGVVLSDAAQPKPIGRKIAHWFCCAADAGAVTEADFDRIVNGGWRFAAAALGGQWAKNCGIRRICERRRPGWSHDLIVQIMNDTHRYPGLQARLEALRDELELTHTGRGMGMGMKHEA